MRITFKLVILGFLLFSNCSEVYPQWIKTSFNLNTRSIVYYHNHFFVATMDSGVFRTSDNGETWIAVNNGITGHTAQSLFVSGDYLLAGGIGLFLTTNNGSSWVSMWSTSGTYFSSVTGIGDNIVAASSASYFGSAVYHSSDFGLSWEKVISSYYEAPSFHVKTFENNIYVTEFSRFMTSQDSGHSWVLKQMPSPYTVGDILKIGNRIFSVGYSAILSTDGGSSWVPITNGITQLGYQNFNVIAQIDSSRIVIGATYGFYLSTNNGTKWTIINEGFTSADVQTLVVSDKYLFAGTAYGVWRRSLSEIVGVIKDKDDMPQQFVLEQNFPNPFNPATTIKYSIPFESDVKLSISNIIGQIIKEENFGIQFSGMHETTLELSTLPSGVYFYTLQIKTTNGKENFRTTKKMNLLK